jgi:hypothetical protein
MLEDVKHVRWIATATYRSEAGTIRINHHFEELFELHALVEHGPDWNALVRIEVILNPHYATSPGITIEESKRLQWRSFRKKFAYRRAI